jgi:SAM-dependent methyltransferase
MEPAPDPVRITARSYEEGARSWHHAHKDEQRAVTRRESYERFADLIGRRGLVLDLGCGSGLDLAELTARGLTAIGLDISGAMLRIARSVAPTSAGYLLRADMRSLPLADGSVDGVWADGSVHHLPKESLLHALHEVGRVLRPGGLFGMSAERGSFEGFVERQEGVTGRRWYSHYEGGELRSMVEAAKREVVALFVGEAGEHTAGFIGLLARRP